MCGVGVARCSYKPQPQRRGCEVKFPCISSSSVISSNFKLCVIKPNSFKLIRRKTNMAFLLGLFKSPQTSGKVFFLIVVTCFVQSSFGLFTLVCQMFSVACRTATKKAGGSSNNGRKTAGKRLGIKMNHGMGVFSL